MHPLLQGLRGLVEQGIVRPVKDLTLGSGIGFEERGEAALKDVPGTWRLYVTNVTSTERGFRLNVS